MREKLSELVAVLSSSDRRSVSRICVLSYLYLLLPPSSSISHSPLSSPPLSSSSSSDPPSLSLKARVAYTLAEYSRVHFSSRVAEKMFLETILLMDRFSSSSFLLSHSSSPSSSSFLSDPPSPSLSTLLFPIGISALSHFCDLLLLLQKVSYGSVISRTLSSLLKVTFQMSKYVDSLTRMSAALTERMELKRAICIYRDILEYYVSQNKVNEVSGERGKNHLDGHMWRERESLGGRREVTIRKKDLSSLLKRERSPNSSDSFADGVCVGGHQHTLLGPRQVLQCRGGPPHCSLSPLPKQQRILASA